MREVVCAFISVRTFCMHFLKNSFCVFVCVFFFFRLCMCASIFGDCTCVRACACVCVRVRARAFEVKTRRRQSVSYLNQSSGHVRCVLARLCIYADQ